MKKRVLALFMILTLFVMTACGNQSSEPNQESAVTTSSTVVSSGAVESVESEDTVQNDEAKENNVPAIEYTYEQKTYGYTLTEVGTIEDAEGDLWIQYDALLESDAGGAKLLTAFGESGVSEYINGINYLGQGLYAAWDTSGEMNSCGLVTESGELLIPFEACSIDWISTLYAESTRYLKVIYTTGETDNIDECFIYSTDSMISLYVSEGDIMYTGYAKVYDTQARAFVEGVTITNSNRYAVGQCGENFVVEGEDGILRLYDPQGELLFQTALFATVGQEYILTSDDKHKVYDSNGELTYVSDMRMSAIEKSAFLVRYNEDRSLAVIDKWGNVVLDNVNGVTGEQNGVFKLFNEDMENALYRVDGVCLLDYQEEYLTEVIPGIWRIDGDDEYVLVLQDGTLTQAVDYGGATNLASVDPNTEKAFVLADMDYTLQLDQSSPTVLDIGLVSANSDSNGKYGVFDLLTGEQLLAYEYSAIKCAGERIYAYKDGVWTVYLVDGPVR